MTSNGLCPKCNAEVQEGANFCLKCGRDLTTDVRVEEKTGAFQWIKRTPVKIGFGVLGVFILVVIGVLGFHLISGGADVGVMYGKDGEIFYANVRGEEHVEITERYNDDMPAMGLAESYMLSYAIHKSENSRYMFYPDRQTEDGMSYYWRDMGKGNGQEEEAVKIDSDIYSPYYTYLTLDGSKFFYIKSDDYRFYVYNRESEEKVKLDSEVSEFFVNDTGDYIIYEKYEEDENNIYEIILTGDEVKKTKVDSDASIRKVDPNAQMVYYLKDEYLYKKVEGSDKVKIDSEVIDVVSIAGHEEVYYVKAKDVTTQLSELILDDMLEADDAMEEPGEPSYPQEPAYPSYSDYVIMTWEGWDWGDEWNSELEEWGYWFEETDYEAYNNAYAAYEEDLEAYYTVCDEIYAQYEQAYYAYQDKLVRDDLRLALKDTANDITYETYSLYYWDGETDTCIAEDLANEYTYDYVLSASSDLPVVAYQTYETSHTDKRKLSTVLADYESGYYYYEDVLYDISSNPLEARNITKDVFVAYADKENILEAKDVKSWRISGDGTIYYLEDYDTEDGYGVLKAVSISEDGLGSPEIIDEDVNGYKFGNANANVYYYKDVKNGSGDIYLDGKSIATDVWINSFYNYPGTDTLLYYVDYSEKNSYGTLCKLQGDQQITISHDVTDFVPIDSTHVAFLIDYNMEKERGDLMVYDGKKENRLIDTDVNGLIRNVDLVW